MTEEKIEVETLEEARKIGGFHAVLWGDGGDAVYLTIPIGIIEVDELTLYNLVLAVDEVLWKEDDSRDVYFEKFNTFPYYIEEGGGTVLKDEIWFNDKIKPEARDIIKEIITNQDQVEKSKEKIEKVKELLR